MTGDGKCAKRTVMFVVRKRLWIERCDTHKIVTVSVDKRLKNRLERSLDSVAVLTDIEIAQFRTERQRRKPKRSIQEPFHATEKFNVPVVITRPFANCTHHLYPKRISSNGSRRWFGSRDRHIRARTWPSEHGSRRLVAHSM
jgi:hypothetical protein